MKIELRARAVYRARWSRVSNNTIIEIETETQINLDAYLHQDSRFKVYEM